MRTWVPGCLWEAGPGVPGPLPWAPGAHPRGLPGGVPAQCLRARSRPAPLDSHQKSCRFCCRFLVVLGSILGPSWGSFSVMLAPFSAQVGLGTVFETTYLRKSDCSRNITFSLGFWPKLTPRWGQDRPKIAPRWVQDRLGSPFFRLEFSLRF